jgi:hypothetical protein
MKKTVATKKARWDTIYRNGVLVKAMWAASLNQHLNGNRKQRRSTQ